MMNKFTNDYSSEFISKISSVCARARVESGLSQSDLAKIFGCSQQLISRFEYGKTDSMALLFLYITYLPKIKPILNFILQLHKELVNNGETDESSDIVSDT